MNHGLAGTTGCANGNDGRYVRSQIHPAIMISDCAEPASAYRESLARPAHATRPSTSSGYPTSMSLARRVGPARRQFHRLLEPAPIGRPKNRRKARNERHCLRPHRPRRRRLVQISLGREIEYLARSVVNSDYRLYSADDLFGPAWVRHELVTDAPVLAGPVYRLRGRLARGPASKQSSDRRNDLSLRPVSSARSGPRALMIVDFVSREDRFFPDWDRSSGRTIFCPFGF